MDRNLPYRFLRGQPLKAVDETRSRTLSGLKVNLEAEAESF